MPTMDCPTSATFHHVKPIAGADIGGCRSADQNALNVSVVKVRSMPSMSCTFSAMK